MEVQVYDSRLRGMAARATTLQSEQQQLLPGFLPSRVRSTCPRSQHVRTVHRAESKFYAGLPGGPKLEGTPPCPVSCATVAVLRADMIRRGRGGCSSHSKCDISVETSTGVMHADRGTPDAVMWEPGNSSYDPDFCGPSTAIWATSSLFLCGA